MREAVLMDDRKWKVTFRWIMIAGAALFVALIVLAVAALSGVSGQFKEAQQNANEVFEQQFE